MPTSRHLVSHGLVVTELLDLGASELAARLQAGDVSAREVVEAHVRRLEAVQSTLNAVAIARYDRALEEAAAADEVRASGGTTGPLHGVPITIKESFDVAGMDSTAGLASRVGAPRSEDSDYVARLRSAGAIVVAKTNLAQLLWFMESDNPVYGRCNNPWDLQRSPGGSSGGEAAAIAVGGSALGLGSDLGGSIRGPAHYTGVAGFKPSTGRLDTTGTLEEELLPGQEAVVAQAGPLARRVADLNLAMSILDRTWRNEDLEVSKLRVGKFDDNGLIKCAPSVRRAISIAAEALKAAGVEVVDYHPPDASEAYELYTGLMTADGGKTMRGVLGGDPVHPRVRTLLFGIGLPGWTRQIGAAIVGLAGQRQLARALRHSGAVPVAAYWSMVDARNRMNERLQDHLRRQSIDLLLGPSLPTPALLHGTCIDVAVGMSYLVIYNLLGWPAGVLPVTCVGADEETDRASSVQRHERVARRIEVGSTGLPVGVQLAAPSGRDAEVMAMMELLEAQVRHREDHPDQRDLVTRLTKER